MKLVYLMQLQDVTFGSDLVEKNSHLLFTIKSFHMVALLISMHLHLETTCKLKNKQERIRSISNMISQKTTTTQDGIIE